MYTERNISHIDDLPGSLCPHFLARQLRLGDVARTGMGQHHLRHLQLCRHVRRRPRGDHSTGSLAEAGTAAPRFRHRRTLHDLGKLLFAFSTFWMYIFFSQYMLTWYANITEESVYYILRQNGVMGVLFLGNVVLNWGIPFLILL